jgi:type IV pilus assembly protein PilC
MQTFDYVAKNKEGELQKGEVEAENQNAAAKVLMGRDLVPVDVYTQTEKGLSFFNKVSLKEKTIIARQLATMINAGLPIAQSLRTIQSQVSNPTVKKMLEQITTDVEGGSTVSNAFSKLRLNV